MKKKFYIVFCIILVLLFTGCGDNSSKSSNNDNVGEETEVYKEKDVTITINEGNLYKISYGNFLYYEENDMFLKAALQYQYQDLIYEVNTFTDEYVSNIINAYGESLQETLIQFGYTDIDNYRQSIFFDSLLNYAITDYAESLIREQEIEDYYNEHIFGPVLVKHILVEIKDNDEELALMEAKDIIKRLNEGESFEELAKKYSDDKSTSESGGSLGEIEHGLLDTIFEEEILELENGTYSKEPLKSSYGYHIFYRVSQKEKPTLDEVRDSIVEELVTEKIENADFLFYRRAEDELINKIIDELEADNIKELLIDDTYYNLYDLNGKAIYGVCASENCMTREFYQIDDFDEMEIVDYGVDK